jgi:hypothetical protein
VKVALIYPPTCDPTAPYLAVPMLAAFLRQHGVEVLPIDANIEAFDRLLQPDALHRLAQRVESRIAELERRPYLPHVEQLAYAALWRVRGVAQVLPEQILSAKHVLRDRQLFFADGGKRYATATAAIDAALRVISAAHAPLALDFTAYRTPFSFLNPDEIKHDAAPAHDPFDEYVQTVLIPQLQAARPSVIGLSVCFPGQLQPAFSFAYKLRAALPDVHLTIGGPGITQLLIRHKAAPTTVHLALGPFDSAVVFEGEHTLLRLVTALDEGRSLAEIPNLVVRRTPGEAGYLPGHGMEDLKQLPAPDFVGLPLDKYLSPKLVLPYDPTRGCYWGKCTFCHYGLAEVGTAAYRERAVPTMVEHLQLLGEKHGTDFFYLSQARALPHAGACGHPCAVRCCGLCTGGRVGGASCAEADRQRCADRGCLGCHSKPVGCWHRRRGHVLYRLSDGDFARGAGHGAVLGCASAAHRGLHRR